MKPEDLDAAPPARLPFPVTRAMSEPVAATRGDGEMPTMVGHFSTFGDPYEVNSHIEGHFLERVAPGAFTKTIRESRSQIKTLYDHGQDPTIGNKVLGPIRDLGEDKIGPYFEVPMYDTSYNRDLAPGIEDGAYGVSFRFSVINDEWDHSPKRSKHNPDAIPERTITEARVYEFGPVTFPANPKADIGVRSTTDTFYQRAKDPEGFEALLRSAQVARTPAGAGAATTPDEPPPVTPTVVGDKGPETVFASGGPVEPTAPDTRGAPPSPPPVVAASQPTETRQDGGSSDSKEHKDMDFASLAEMEARYDELEGEMADQLAAHPVDMPEDEKVGFEARADERDTLGKKIAERKRLEARLGDRLPKPGSTERGFDPAQLTTQKPIIRKTDAELHSPETRSTTWEGREAEYRDDAKRLLEKTRLAPGAPDAERTKGAIEDILDYTDEKGELARRIKYTSSPAYLRAFHKYITSKGSTFGFTPEEQRGTALAVGVDGTGGFTVPFAFDPTVIAIGAWTGAVNPYRAACRVVTISGTDTWNALTATAVVATRTTEAAASTEQGPTFAQPQYIVKRVQGQITASFEMFQDRTDLASEMSRLIQEAKDNEEEASWATGNGSGSASIGVGPVTGTSGSYTRVSTASGGTLAAGDFDATEAALPVRHRFRAQWFANRLNIRRAQAVETAGGKLFQQSQYFQSAGNVDLSRDGNTGLRLLGYPVNESPSLPTSTATTITGLVLLNVDQYVIVDRIGLSVQFMPFITNSSGLATGQQGLYFLYRNHAAPLNTDAGRILQYL